MGHAYAAALSEGMVFHNAARGKIHHLEAPAAFHPTSEDGDTRDACQGGSCGFSVALYRPNGNVCIPCLGMCHHYTWDGQHCATAGLSSEHANRCAGSLCETGNMSDVNVCKTGLQVACSAGAVGDTDGTLREVVCSMPIW